MGYRFIVQISGSNTRGLVLALWGIRVRIWDIGYWL
jgi:hypothetical protein